MNAFENALLKVRADMAPAEKDELVRALAVFINDLLLHDFSRLVLLLYRVDVNEKKLKIMLKEHADRDAGELIAGLVIARQLEKIRTRQQYRSGPDSSSEEERW